MSERRKKIHVDALVENDGLSAIAVAQNGGSDSRPVIAKVVSASGSVEAEFRALLLAMDIAKRARWGAVDFFCDASGVVRMVSGVAACRPENLQPLKEKAQMMIEDNPGWRVRWVKRTHNSSAHALAGQVMKAYKQGRSDALHGRRPR